MADLAFDIPPVPTIPVVGAQRRYPVRRIFCVGRNYAAHAAEMGFEVDREAPFYFTKSPAALVLSGAEVPYPPGTSDYHHEVELVVALGAPVFRADRQAAAGAVWGYGCGLDMTRRDVQQAARKQGRPWDLGKDVEHSAVMAPLTPAAQVPPLGAQRIWLRVNGRMRQDALLSELIHDVPAIIADLSRYYHLGPGDLIFTGTPAGVGPVVAGDRIEGGIDGLEAVHLALTPAE